MRALGFCVSVKHEQFMARVFNKIGIPQLQFLVKPIGRKGRRPCRISRRRINVVFSVDLFNEGVDVPTVDTLLLLRPTESATLFLQQLGRGLRKHRDQIRLYRAGLCWPAS